MHTSLGESDTGSILLPPFFSLIYQSDFIVLYSFTLPLFSHNLSPLDNSEEGSGEERKLLTKEEEDVDILCSWMEVGGQPALPEGEAQGLLAEVSKFPCPLFFFF